MNQSNTFKDCLDQLPGSILIANPQGNIIYGNKAISDQTGYPISEIIGQKPGQLWGGHMPHNFYQNLWHTVKQKKQIFTGSVNNLTKHGNKYTQPLNLAPLLNDIGETTYYIAIHANLKSAAAEHIFQKEFRELMSLQNGPNARIIFHIFKWLAGERQIPPILFTYAQNLTKNTSDLVSAIKFLFLSQNETALKEDHDLIHASQKDPHHFDKLYLKYKGRVFNYLHFRLDHNQDLAEELMQETFTKAFHALPRFIIGESNYLSYLLMIAHNLVINYYRSYRPILIAHIHEQEETPKFVDVIEKSRLWKTIKKLSFIEQEIFSMRYQKDLSIKAIAHNLKKSENAIKLTLSRARKKLRTELF